MPLATSTTGHIKGRGESSECVQVRYETKKEEQKAVNVHGVHYETKEVQEETAMDDTLCLKGWRLTQ
jgi:hypothetical protein